MTWLYHTLPDCTRVWRWLPESYRRSRGIADAGCVKQAGALPAMPAYPGARMGEIQPYSLRGWHRPAASGLGPAALPLAAGGLVGGGFATGYYGPGLVAEALAPGGSPAILIGDQHGVRGAIGGTPSLEGLSPASVPMGGIPVSDYVPLDKGTPIPEPGGLAILALAALALILIRARA
jgi:hypothetical protein